MYMCDCDTHVHYSPKYTLRANARVLYGRTHAHAYTNHEQRRIAIAEAGRTQHVPRVTDRRRGGGSVLLGGGR